LKIRGKTQMNVKITKKGLIISLSIIAILAIAGLVFFITKGNFGTKSAVLTLNECTQTINAANGLIDQVVLQKRGKEIGKIDNNDIIGFKGDYKAFSDLKKGLAQYYDNDEDIYLDLIRRGVYVVDQKLGILRETDILPFVTSENSQNTIISDLGNVKTVQVKSQFGDKEAVGTYTLEKLDKKSGIKIKKVETPVDYSIYYMVNKVEASSTDTGSLPQNALDNNRYTAWIEGNKDKSKGTWLKFDFSKPVELSYIGITNGNSKTRPIYNENNRIKNATIEFSDGTKVKKIFEDFTLFGQNVKLPAKVKTDYVKINIEGVYNGKINKTCISEVIFKGKPVDKK
jgi:hypothetical protein